MSVHHFTKRKWEGSCGTVWICLCYLLCLLSEAPDCIRWCNWDSRDPVKSTPTFLASPLSIVNMLATLPQWAVPAAISCNAFRGTKFNSLCCLATRYTTTSIEMDSVVHTQTKCNQISRCVNYNNPHDTHTRIM